MVNFVYPVGQQCCCKCERYTFDLNFDENPPERPKSYCAFLPANAPIPNATFDLVRAVSTQKRNCWLVQALLRLCFDVVDEFWKKNAVTQDIAKFPHPGVLESRHCILYFVFCSVCRIFWKQCIAFPQKQRLKLLSRKTKLWPPKLNSRRKVQ